MPEWIEVILLGIIEGITEFLPISSTGHLLVAQHWMARRQSDLFLVVIQSGAVVAVMLVFQARLKQLFFQWREPEARDYLAKLGVAFLITCVGGLLLKVFKFQLPETPVPVGVALLVGGLLFLVIETWLRGRTLSDQLAWRVVIAMGLAQLLAAIFPGTSRSGATILIALVLGLDRRVAIEFSFLLGVPTLLAAGALQLASHFHSPTPEPVNWGLVLLGTVVSAITAFVAVKWLLRYVQSHTFELFGWYRIAAGLFILALLV
jgi:undecaprenyl-diphosphatase